MKERSREKHIEGTMTDIREQRGEEKRQAVREVWKEREIEAKIAKKDEW